MSSIELLSALRQLIVETVAASVAYAAATGATGDDPRLYWYFNGEAEIGPQKPAYVTYTLVSGGEATSVDLPVFGFMLWAAGDNAEALVALRAAMLGLFHQQTFTVNGQTVYAKKVNETDSFQPNQNFSGFTLHFRFGYCTV